LDLLSAWTLLGLLAQAVPAAPADGISFTLLLSTIAGEGLLSKLTWDGFNAETRIQKDSGNDIRDARAGFTSGTLVPAAAQLIDAVLRIRRPNEPIRDALERTDTSAQLDALVEAAAVSKSPREYESRLVRVWTVVGGATLALQVSGLALMINPIANKDLLSDTVQTVAIVAASGAAALLAAFLLAVRHFARQLARAIRNGKDAGRGA
jgi:hypothetical protein